MRASIVIRTLNEGQYLGDLLTLINEQVTQGIDIETVLIDSGSTDGTVDIAMHHGARVTHIPKAKFSFGRSLNWGSAFATGDILVYISGHCMPVNEQWLQTLCQPLIDGHAAYSYGRQVGDNNSNYSERRIFAKYFPDESAIPQEGFFCNNANSALLRTAWAAHSFNEELTGLEDMELAKRLTEAGGKVAYVAEAPVFHHHEESWAQIRRRFEREALALRAIMPEIQLSMVDVLRCIQTSTVGDWRAAARNGVSSTAKRDMLRYRWNQYLGSYQGNRENRRLSQSAKERFYYPQPNEKALNDDWLGSLHRASSDEGQQPEGKGQEFSASAR